MDNHSRFLCDYGWFHGIRRKPAHPSVVARRARIVFSDGKWRFPKNSKAEIEDKSKGDAISKAIRHPANQLVCDPMHRSRRPRPTDHTGAHHFAFASLNFVIYIVWWEKPLNVQRGVRVYKKRTDA
jgi:hypothetical protein